MIYAVVAVVVIILLVVLFTKNLNGHSCYVDKCEFFKSISQITHWENKGNIFISTLQTAKCDNIIRLHNIKAVINVSTFDYESAADKYIKISILDSSDVDICDHFESCFKFIDYFVENNYNILIHCFAGISRSVSIVISYLMRKERKNYDAVLSHIRKKRIIAWPNSGFEAQLRKYQNQLKIY